MFNYRESFEPIESNGAIIGLAGLPRILALACSKPLFLDPLNPVAMMGIRGQIGAGSRITTTTGKAFGLDMYMDDIDNALKALNTERISLMGYSHGGYFATAYALRNPDRVSSLILIEPALFTDSGNLLKRAEICSQGDGIAALEAMLDFVAPAQDMSVRRSMAEEIQKDWESNAALAGEFRVRAENPISEEQLGTLKMPVLLIGGTDSDVSGMVARAATAIPKASVWWVKGVNHLDFYTMPENVSQEIVPIINQFLYSDPGYRKRRRLAGEKAI